MKLYDELAGWWPLFSHPDEYAEEATFYGELMREWAERDVVDVLELGSGGGNNASHLKETFDLTLVEPSAGMIEVSRELNPELRHVQGDMRSIRLDETFDAVFVHDAVAYMLTDEDLRAAAETAAVHLRPGGVALFVPDETTESFAPRTETGGHDGDDGRALRYLEWSHDKEPDARTYRISFAIMLREADGEVRCVLDEHTFGVHPRGIWFGLLEDAGLAAHAVEHDYGTPGEGYFAEAFIGLKP